MLTVWHFHWLWRTLKCCCDCDWDSRRNSCRFCNLTFAFCFTFFFFFFFFFGGGGNFALNDRQVFDSLDGTGFTMSPIALNYPSSVKLYCDRETHFVISDFVHELSGYLNSFQVDLVYMLINLLCDYFSSASTHYCAFRLLHCCFSFSLSMENLYFSSSFCAMISYTQCAQPLFLLFLHV